MPSGEGGSVKLYGESALDMGFDEGVDKFGSGSARWARFHRFFRDGNIFGPNLCQGMDRDTRTSGWGASTQDRDNLVPLVPVVELENLCIPVAHFVDPLNLVSVTPYL
jgi:hypothetical protein